MLNLWFSIATFLLIVMLCGVAAIFDPIPDDYDGECFRDRFHDFITFAGIGIMMLAPLWVPLLLWMGNAAHDGEIWGLIPIK